MFSHFSSQETEAESVGLYLGICHLQTGSDYDCKPKDSFFSRDTFGPDRALPSPCIIFCRIVCFSACKTRSQLASRPCPKPINSLGHVAPKEILILEAIRQEFSDRPIRLKIEVHSCTMHRGHGMLANASCLHAMPAPANKKTCEKVSCCNTDAWKKSRMCPIWLWFCYQASQK